MADVLTLSGEEFTPPEPNPENGMAKYLRDLADLIESGKVSPDAMVVVLALPGGTVSLQRIGIETYSAIGLLAVAQRIAIGV